MTLGVIVATSGIHNYEQGLFRHTETGRHRNSARLSFNIVPLVTDRMGVNLYQVKRTVTLKKEAAATRVIGRTRVSTVGP